MVGILGKKRRKKIACIPALKHMFGRLNVNEWTFRVAVGLTLGRVIKLCALCGNLLL